MICVVLPILSASILMMCRKSSVFNRYFLKTTNSALLLNKTPFAIATDNYGIGEQRNSERS
jgi:hypothetical protein